MQHISNTTAERTINQPRDCPSPREKIASDLFTFNNSDYLCTVDYYSNCFEIDRLYDKTTSESLRSLSVISLRTAYQTKYTVIICDSPQGNFKILQRNITSSLEYPQSNDKGENSIKTAKNLIKKARESGQDVCLPFITCMEKYTNRRYG